MIMKNIYTFVLMLMGGLFTSCSDYLDVVPDGTPEIEYAFRDRTNAMKYLATCYSGLPHVGSPHDPAMLGSDETFMFYNTSDGTDQMGNYNSYWMKLGKQNAANPYCDFWSGLNSGKNMWQQIRNCNIFLENIDNVGPQLTSEELDRWKAEVKVLKAYFHFYLLRMYGPIPLKQASLSVEASTEEVRAYRDTFDDCVSYIDELIEEAYEYLPAMVEDPTTEMGRITKAAALAIRADLWLTAASPLFNGNEDYKDFEDNRGVRLFPQSYDAEKWVKAAKYAKEAIDAAHEAGNQLYQFNDTEWRAYQLSPERYLEQTLRCVASDRWNSEIIWANNNNTVEKLQFASIPFLIGDDLNYVPFRPCIGVTLNAAERFYTINGVPIDEDPSWNYDSRYNTVKIDANMNITDENGEIMFNQEKFIQKNFVTAGLNVQREVRYYANIGFDGGYWWGNGNYNDIPYVLKSKQGDVSGKQSSIRYSITGMFAKKPGNVKTARAPQQTYANYYRYSFPFYRLADLYLMYAEAMNEVEGPSEEVYHYVDLVRERAGLDGVVESWEMHSIYPAKPTSKDGLREIIQRERTNELFMEGKFYWDVRRWKQAHIIYNTVVRGWNVEAKEESEYYINVAIEKLKFNLRDYLYPIREYDLRVNTNLVQNPYWE